MNLPSYRGRPDVEENPGFFLNRLARAKGQGRKLRGSWRDGARGARSGEVSGAWVVARGSWRRGGWRAAHKTAPQRPVAGGRAGELGRQQSPCYFPPHPQPGIVHFFACLPFSSPAI